MGNCTSDQKDKLFRKQLKNSNGFKIIEEFIHQKIFDHHENMISQHIPCCCICHINHCYNTCTRCHKNEFLSMLINEYELVKHAGCQTNPTFKKPIRDFQDNYFCINYDAQLNNFVCNQDILSKVNSSFSDYRTFKFPSKQINLCRASNYVEKDDSGLTKIDLIKHENLLLTSNCYTQKINDNILSSVNKNFGDEKSDKKMLENLASDKLKLESIIESVGFILMPSAKYAHQALVDLLSHLNCLESFKNHEFCQTDFKSLKFQELNQDIINDVLNLLCSNSNTSVNKWEKKIGYLYFKCLYNDYKRQLESISSSIQAFYSNLNSFNEPLLNHENFASFFKHNFVPIFRSQTYFSSSQLLKIILEPKTKNSFFQNFYCGLIEASGHYVFQCPIYVESSSTDFSYLVTTDSDQKFLFAQDDFISENPEDLAISVEIFKSTYPFTILINRDLLICQVGDGLSKQIGHLIIDNLQFETYFEIIKPNLNLNFDELLFNQNMGFILKIFASDMLLKGSVTYLAETDCLMFICSPVISSLEDLTGRGLFISDIPIHDSTRDVILVGEQTKAQEGLKFRMEKLNKSIIQAKKDTEENKQKNIELLNMIFPSDIATLLWRGEKVQARNLDCVTLLYSDIVGFTSICSSAQPIEVIEMLKRLYTDFDHVCEMLDVYKIETIGDAYIVAGGLHRPSDFQAQQIAWMALLMMKFSSSNYTPQGNEIRMRIGIHSGEVLAGIVGFKQPRYCLFGNNCTITNKLESNSEVKKIHVSSVAKNLIEKVDGFEFVSRGADFLPENWDQNLGNESWFLNSYKNKNLPESENIMEHIQEALKQYKIDHY